ncbi:glycosyl hydrolase catalytic core-domain-containing protein [Rhodotorula diobovata]|uniref:Glycosyl hydrolase catalytic core-domain-containing protein n=1 Tax=Rhodotorula diobovata TaxID=5288 RepID=A0A5C5FY50_9BASI|nr:glycosyl hydrolase catalytic core-domain-containing protein [Rhodotorula diobovata]
MHLTTLLSFALLASTALACTDPTGAGASADLSTLEHQLRSAEKEAAKAARLVERAKSYGNSKDAKHKRAVFNQREKRWEAEAARLEKLVVRQRKAVSAQATASPRSSTLAKTTSRIVRVPTSSRKASTTRSTTVAAISTRSSSKVAVTPTSRPSKKKGVGHNDAKLAQKLDVSWVYNWGQCPDGSLGAGVEYVPMLWSDNAGDWFVNAQKAIDSGSTHLLAFNEPDLVGQADMTIDAVVAGWKKYMSPFKGEAKLVSPAVTNGAAPLGRDYLATFFAACPTCFDETNAIALHWYDRATNVAYFKAYLTEAYARFKKPLWLTEFAGSGTVAEQQQFFKTVLPWMEAQPWIERYAGFGDFVGTYVNADGSLKSLGRSYSETK